MINVVVLVGRLTKDPELRKTSSGVSSCSFTLAVDRSFKGQNGQKETDFINCIAWRTTADLMCQYLGKGSLIGITGRVQAGSYDNAQGEKIFRTNIVADSVQFLEPRGSRAAAQPGYAPAGGYQPYPGQESYQQGGYPGAPAYGQGQDGGYSSGFGQQPASYPQGANQSMGANPYASKPADHTNPLDSAFNESEGLDIADDDLPF